MKKSKNHYYPFKNFEKNYKPIIDMDRVMDNFIGRRLFGKDYRNHINSEAVEFYVRSLFKANNLTCDPTISLISYMYKSFEVENQNSINLYNAALEELKKREEKMINEAKYNLQKVQTPDKLTLKDVLKEFEKEDMDDMDFRYEQTVTPLAGSIFLENMIDRMTRPKRVEPEEIIDATAFEPKNQDMSASDMNSIKIKLTMERLEKSMPLDAVPPSIIQAIKNSPEGYIMISYNEFMYEVNKYAEELNEMYTRGEL